MYIMLYYVIGFRPNCFTCIAHLYLYYTLLVLHFTCTAHLCLLYKALMYIFSFMKYNTNPLVFLTATMLNLISNTIFLLDIVDPDFESA